MAINKCLKDNSILTIVCYYYNISLNLNKINVTQHNRRPYQNATLKKKCNLNTIIILLDNFGGGLLLFGRVCGWEGVDG